MINRGSIGKKKTRKFSSGKHIHKLDPRFLTRPFVDQVLEYKGLKAKSPNITHPIAKATLSPAKALPPPEGGPLISRENFLRGPVLAVHGTLFAIRICWPSLPRFSLILNLQN